MLGESVVVQTHCKMYFIIFVERLKNKNSCQASLNFKNIEYKRIITTTKSPKLPLQYPKSML